jgi:hypothetical protein
VTDRQVLRREVRAALAGARGEADWVARMKAAGLLVSVRADAKDPRRVVGYAVALPPGRGAGKVRWLSGRLLDQDLSLNRIRQRWPDGERLSPQQWRDVEAREQRVLSGPQRIEVWRATVAALADVTARLDAVDAGSPEWPSIARSCADVLAVTAVVAEPSGQGPVSSAADILARAAAPKRRDAAPTDSAIARELGRIADAMTISGAARHGGEAAIVVALVVAAARLIVALARLREAQQQAHAAGAARVAAERMMPLLRQAHQVVPSTVAAAPVTERDTAVGATPARPAASRASPGAHRNQQDREQER